MKKKYNIPKLMGCSKSSSQREVYKLKVDKQLHEEKSKISNKEPNSIMKETKKKKLSQNLAEGRK